MGNKHNERKGSPLRNISREDTRTLYYGRVQGEWESSGSVSGEWDDGQSSRKIGKKVDRDRDESRVCKDSEKEDSPTKYIRPTVISELAPVFIAGDGKIFLHEKEAKTYQEKIMEVFKEDTKLTDKQKKKKVINFLNEGNDDKVLSWVEIHIDIFEEMWHRMNEWDDVTYKEEYDILVQQGFIDED